MQSNAIPIKKPYRAKHSYTQKIAATPEAVFPMLCPVREAEWLEGWAPTVVFSHSGVAEEDCVFITPRGEREAVWVVVRHDPVCHEVEMIYIIPEVTVCRLQIEVRPNGANASTANVTYSHTALGPEGRALVDQFTPTAYVQFMEAWESALNSWFAQQHSTRP